jgi:hypothetical protein
MSTLLASERVDVAGSAAPLAFEFSGGKRLLCLDGEKAYQLGPGCDTCGFIFERLGGATRSVSATKVADELRWGLDALDPKVLDSVAEVVPPGSYRVVLVEIVPELVRPGESRDYFAHEQVAVWGVDPFYGLPQHPRTEYYRGLSRRVDQDSALFEFVVPMFPSRWLDGQRIAEWERHLRDGNRPTALALGLVLAKEPALIEHDPAPARHLCLAHFLLDGHHRVFAAAATAKRVTLLSFLSVDESDGELGVVLDELRRA